MKEDEEAVRLSVMEVLPVPSVTPFLSVGILMGQRPRIIIGRLPGHLNKAAAHKVLAHRRMRHVEWGQASHCERAVKELQTALTSARAASSPSPSIIPSALTAHHQRNRETRFWPASNRRCCCCCCFQGGESVRRCNQCTKAPQPLVGRRHFFDLCSAFRFPCA